MISQGSLLRAISNVTLLLVGYIFGVEIGKRRAYSEALLLLEEEYEKDQFETMKHEFEK